jgi:hypothetical protein
MNKIPYQTISVFPLFLSCIYIVSSTFNHEIEYIINTSVFPILFSFVFIIVLLASLTIGLITRNVRYIQIGFNTICALTPLSLIYPWVAAPGNIGIGYGGYVFFLDWLLKYPNFANINIEVFIGLLCVLLSSSIPAIYCYLYVSKKRYQKVLLLLVFIEIAAYLPVLIKLDWLLFLSGIAIRDVSVLNGPSLRFLSFLILTGITSLNLVKHNNLLKVKNKTA